jgi:hypothetical protein
MRLATTCALLRESSVRLGGCAINRAIAAARPAAKHLAAQDAKGKGSMAA